VALIWIVYRITEDKRCEGGERLLATGWVCAPTEEEALCLARTKFAPDPNDCRLTVEQTEGEWGWIVGAHCFGV
jgi:hypothetical protein